MKHHQLGLSLLEVVIAASILAALVIPAFQLFSVQRHQVSSTQRELLLHGYGLQRLAEEESRLNIAGFNYPYPANFGPASLPPPGMPPIQETLSIGPTGTTSGLWQISIQLAYKDLASGPTANVSLSKLIVDRDLCTRLPAESRNVP